MGETVDMVSPTPISTLQSRGTSETWWEAPLKQGGTPERLWLFHGSFQGSRGKFYEKNLKVWEDFSNRDMLLEPKFCDVVHRDKQTCREPWVDTALDLVLTFCAISIEVDSYTFSSSSDTGIKKDTFADTGGSAPEARTIVTNVISKVILSEQSKKLPN